MKKKYLLFSIILSLCILLGGCGKNNTANAVDNSTASEDYLTGRYHISIEVSGYGTITAELDADNANSISHVRGTISMARSNDPDSASSQFFIMQKDNTGLDGKYAAFGTVTDGMDIVDKICKDAADTDDNGIITDKSKQPVITKITVAD